MESIRLVFLRITRCLSHWFATKLEVNMKKILMNLWSIHREQYPTDKEEWIVFITIYVIMLLICLMGYSATYI